MTTSPSNPTPWAAPIFDHVMIDIETMSLSAHNALILSIGIIEFDPAGVYQEGPGVAEMRIGQRSLILPNLEQQLALGREMSNSTQAWWKAQKPEARMHWLDPEAKRVSLADACRIVKVLCARASRVWANGTQFDLSNLTELNKQLGSDGQDGGLWHYQAPRDMRTFVRETPMSRIVPIGDAMDIKGVAHEPVYDCEIQAWEVWAHWQDH